MALPALLVALVIGASVGVFTALGQGTGDVPATEVSGNCDEAEHAADPQCAGAPTDRDDAGPSDRGHGRDHPEDDGTVDDRDDHGDDGIELGDDHGAGDDDPAGDISGNCDEAEHAADPECTGVAPATAVDDVDNSGPGSASSGPGSSGEELEVDDDSGPGSDDSGSDDSDSGSDSSGPGSGDDD